MKEFKAFHISSCLGRYTDTLMGLQSEAGQSAAPPGADRHIFRTVPECAPVCTPSRGHVSIAWTKFLQHAIFGHLKATP